MDRQAALLELATGYAVGLRMHDAGAPAAEIALALGIPETSVACLIRIAEAKIAALLEQADPVKPP